MKFKLFSAVLLLVCFLFLGIVSGVIPVTELPRDVTAGLFPSRSASPAPVHNTEAPPVSPVVSPSPTHGTPVLPEAKTVPSYAPVTVPPVTVPPATAAPVTVPPTSAPTPAPVKSAPAGDLWEPAAEVISTTITWNDPLQNDTAYSVDASALLDMAPDVTLPADGPQILIIHTHGTEAYTPDGTDQYQASGDYRTTDPDHSILKVGRALGDALEEYGLDVLVDEGLYDWPSYDGAYARSGEAIESCLAQYPTIRVVIDLHRDAIGDDTAVYKTVSDALEPEAAQMMFVVGTDETLSHPNWRENLSFAMSLQGLLDRAYPHLMRPALLSSNRYNQQLAPASVLLEIGTDGNTLQEALTSAELFAQVVGPALAEKITG